MKRILTAMTMCLLTACFNAPELPLGTFDAGTNTGGGGGAANTGGGGGSSTGGGSGQVSDGGLVAALADLPEASCGAQRVFFCAGGGSCITWETPNTDAVVATREQLGTIENLSGRIDDQFVWVSQATDGGSTLWTVAPGVSPRALQTTPVGTGLQYLSSLSLSTSGYAWWFVGDYVTGPGHRFDINYVIPGGPVATAMTKTTYPTSNGVAVGTDYFVALSDGLYSFYPAGESRLVATTGVNGDKIHSVAVDEVNEFIFYVRYDTQNGDRLMRRKLRSQDEVLMASLPQAQSVGAAQGSALAVHDGHVYALSVVGLYRLPVNTPGPLELVFAGEDFPQYGGTLKNLSLVRRGDKLYFGKVCYFDADAPGYGTIELDITQRTARWLDLDPLYPVVPHVTSYDAWANEGPVYAGPNGVFITR